MASWYFRPYRGDELKYSHLEKVRFYLDLFGVTLYATARCIGIERNEAESDLEDDKVDPFDLDDTYDPIESEEPYSDEEDDGAEGYIVGFRYPVA